MTDQIQSIRDDLAFMKSLVDDEGRPPALMGAQLLAAGLLYGVPIIPAWAALRGIIHMPTGWTSMVSVYSTIAYVPVSIWLYWVYRKPVRPTPSARPFVAGWSALGLSTFAMLIIIFVSGAKLHERQMWQVWTCICFTIYGAAWWVVAILRRSKGWGLVALGSYATAVVNAFFVSTPDVLLGCGLGIIAWLGGPGLVILMQSRARR